MSTLSVNITLRRVVDVNMVLTWTPCWLTAFQLTSVEVIGRRTSRDVKQILSLKLNSPISPNTFQSWPSRQSSSGKVSFGRTPDELRFGHWQHVPISSTNDPKTGPFVDQIGMCCIVLRKGQHIPFSPANGVNLGVVAGKNGTCWHSQKKVRSEFVRSSSGRAFSGRTHSILPNLERVGPICFISLFWNKNYTNVGQQAQSFYSVICNRKREKLHPTCRNQWNHDSIQYQRIKHMKTGNIKVG